MKSSNHIFLNGFFQNHPKYRGCTFTKLLNLQIYWGIYTPICVQLHDLLSLSLQVKLQSLYTHLVTTQAKWTKAPYSHGPLHLFLNFPPQHTHAHTSRTVGNLSSVTTSFVQSIYSGYTQLHSLKDSTRPHSISARVHGGLYLEFKRAINYGPKGRK